jgi:ABC-type branched-subunit amino acid transport system permease subunit
MRAFLIAADVIMGLILGLFLHVVIIRTWPTLEHPAVALVVFGAAVLVVLFRRPSGSLARRTPDQRAR